FSSFADFGRAFQAVVLATGVETWQFSFEWGRALFGVCGIVVAQIIATKESEGRRWIFLDAGQNVVGGGHAAIAHNRVDLLTLTAGTEELVDTTIAGPLCFRSDVIVDDLPLPTCGRGALVAIHDAGA